MELVGARLVWILGVAMSTLAPQALPAQEVCDPVLKTDMTDPLSYQRREDRCEGLFVQQVSGGLQVASLHFTPRAFTSAVGKTVQLSWNSPLERPSRLRAVSLKPKVYYRMDTLRPPESTSYGWPTDLLDRLDLSSDDIGLLSWQNVEIAGRKTELLSPVSIDGAAGPIEIVLLPDIALEEVYVSLTPLDDAGRVGEYLVSNKPLDYGIYPARRPVVARLPSLENPGVYRLEIGALFNAGGSSSQDVLFFYPGE